MTRFDRPSTTFYRSTNVTIALSCTLFIVTLKCGLEVTEGHWKWYHLTDRIRVPISVGAILYRLRNRASYCAVTFLCLSIYSHTNIECAANRDVCDAIRYLENYIKELIVETDYPSFDVNVIIQAMLQCVKHKGENIMTFRDNCFKSVMTGIVAPMHKTPWKDDYDDSLESYLRN